MLTFRMTAVLDDIRFLADSAHRAVVLDALADGPRSRGELRNLTGASSATVGRIVQAFEERGWLVRDGSRYELTALGAFVAESFAELYGEMELAHELEGLLRYVPLRTIGIEVDQFRDAYVTRVSQDNPFAVISRVRELEFRSRDAQSLTDFFPEPCIDGRYESVVRGSQTFEAVFAPIVFEAAMASDAAEKFEALVASDRSEIYVYDGEIEYPVMIHDGVGCLVVRNEENISVGMVETDEETFLAWVTDVFEQYRAEATPLEARDLSTPLEKVLARA